MKHASIILFLIVAGRSTIGCSDGEIDVAETIVPDAGQDEPIAETISDQKDLDAGKD